MKNLLFLLLLVPTVAMVQPDATSGISAALKSGNAEALGTYFSNSVEIAVMDSEDRYSKAEAIKVMQSFFTKYNPTGYTQVHAGVSKGGALHYSIGEMQTSQRTFRVYMLLENNKVIQQLRIDEE